MKSKLDLTGKKIIISRTDSIGDVMLVLPICSWLKAKFPGVTIYFLGSAYTQAVVESYGDVDAFLDWTALSKQTEKEQILFLKNLNIDCFLHAFPRKAIARLAKKSGIPYRIGTSHRLFHFLTCNVKVDFTRKNSELHESQLNFELLRPFGLTEIPSFDDLNKMTSVFKPESVLLPEFIEKSLKPNKSIILHPKSQGSAVEWPVQNYMALATKLVEKGYTVFFTGTEKEGALFRDELPISDFIKDTTGKLTLKELIAFIAKAEALVACSTGPMHIAGFCGIHAIGLFSPRRPIHPGRWQALGKRATALVYDGNCSKCTQKESCDCIQMITVEQVLKEIARLPLEGKQ